MVYKPHPFGIWGPITMVGYRLRHWHGILPRAESVHRGHPDLACGTSLGWQQPGAHLGFLTRTVLYMVYQIVSGKYTRWGREGFIRACAILGVRKDVDVLWLRPGCLTFAWKAIRRAESNPSTWKVRIATLSWGAWEKARLGGAASKIHSTTMV